MINKNFFGEDQVVLWMGIVENRRDPLGLGRIQVRIFGTHTDSISDIPSTNLPWAHPSFALNDKGFSTPREAEVVFGFYADGADKQIPVVMGVIPGYNTTPTNVGAGFGDLRSQEEIKYAPRKPVSRTYNTDGSGVKLAEPNVADPNVLESLRHPTNAELHKSSITGLASYENLTGTVLADRKINLDKNVVTANKVQWSEPYPAYNALYPYNSVVETESGHSLELDDTPASERVALSHRSGTFFEVFPSGTKVEKITKSNYRIVMSDDHVHVMGKVLVTMDGDVLMKVAGDIFVEAGNDLNMSVAGKMNLSVGEDLNFKAASVNFDIAGDAAIVAGGNQFLTAGSHLSLKAGGTLSGDGSKSDFQNGSAAAGTPTGIAAPAGRSSKNSFTAPEEAVPLPLPGSLAEFDPETGLAFRQSQFLTTNPDGTKSQPADNIPPQPCNFDESAHTFISDPLSWDISDSGIEMIKTFEGLAKIVKPGFVTPYPDPQPPLKPVTITVGYGTTGASIDKNISLGELISLETAESYLTYAIENKFIPTLRKYVKVPLTQQMIDALISFIFNVGSGNFAGSTLLKKLNNKDWCGAADSFLVWNRSGGTVLPNLSSRRKIERSVFIS